MYHLGVALSALMVVAACDPTGSLPKSGKQGLHITVVSLQGCTATPRTMELIREVASELGAAMTLEHVIVRTQEEARAHRHIGSPTVQINGMDIEPEARDVEQFGIT